MLSYTFAQKKAEKGLAIDVIIVDSLWHRHDFRYSRDVFPDMTFGEFVAFFWKRYGDEGAALRFYAA